MDAISAYQPNNVSEDKKNESTDQKDVDLVQELNRAKPDQVQPPHLSTN